MRIVGSSAMSRDVLWRVSGPALEWRAVAAGLGLRNWWLNEQASS